MASTAALSFFASRTLAFTNCNSRILPEQRIGQGFLHSCSLFGSYRLDPNCKHVAKGQIVDRRSYATASAHLSKEFVIVGGGNSAGYAGKAFVDGGLEGGKLLIVSSETVAPYERPALTKAYLHPLGGNVARLPNFHTSVGGGGEKQTPEWYKEKGIELHLGTTVTQLDPSKKTITTDAGDSITYENLIIATGAVATRLPEKIGGNLPGVAYIRNVADADSLVELFKGAKKLVVVGGGYIGLEVSAAASAWGIDTTVVFPEAHVMQRLFTPEVAAHYEDFYLQKGIKIIKGDKTEKFTAGSDGRVAKVELSSGAVLDADLVVVGIGAKPAVKPFLEAGLQESQGGIQVDNLFRTSAPGVLAIGDVATFPLKIYDRTTRVEHVGHARQSATHAVRGLLGITTEPYDYLPYFYSRVFEHPGSDRKLWWQFYGDNVGESITVGALKPKLATFWVDQGKVKGVFLESGSPEEFGLLPKLARAQPEVDVAKLKAASSVETALEIAAAALH